MSGMVEVTLVRCGEESQADVVVRQRVGFTSSEFPIRRNMRGFTLPTWWSYMLHEYGACSGTFRVPAAGSIAVVEAPIDWSSVEAIPAPSERCESLVTTQPGGQVVRVTPQRQTPGPGRPVLVCGALLLSQLLQQKPRPP